MFADEALKKLSAALFDTYDSNKDMDDLRKSMSKVLEIDYQLQHRKVANRYSSDKFYANDFKRKKRKKQ